MGTVRMKDKEHLTDLELWFRIYNKRYFRNSLPECEIKWADLKWFGHQGVRYVRKRANGRVELEPRYYIRIAKDTRGLRSTWHMTLLHELCHLKLRDGDGQHQGRDHGHKFQREMKRLANMGAFNGLW